MRAPKIVFRPSLIWSTDPFFRVQQSSEFRRSAAAALSPPTQSIATFTSTSSVDLSRSRTQPVQDKADRKAEKCEDCLLKENVEMTALRKLAWNGIPDFLRPAAWPLLLGYLPLSSSARAATLNRKREEYRNLVDLTFKRGKEGLDQQIWHQIEIDVPRTRPGVRLWMMEGTQRASPLIYTNHNTKLTLSLYRVSNGFCMCGPSGIPLAAMFKASTTL